MAAAADYPSNFAQFNQSQRIQQLNHIEAVDDLPPFKAIVYSPNTQDVAKLLQSAGLAIRALTDQSDSTATEQTIAPAILEQRKDKFSGLTARYFGLLSSLDVRLRRQIYALEEAEIVANEAPPKESQVKSSTSAAFAVFEGRSTSSKPSQAGMEKVGSRTGGLGSLEVGWLNGRKDWVGKRFESGLWKSARDYLEALEEGNEKEQTEGSREF